MKDVTLYGRYLELNFLGELFLWIGKKGCLYNSYKNRSLELTSCGLAVVGLKGSFDELGDLLEVQEVGCYRSLGCCNCSRGRFL